jgi:hypothetical protein
MIGLSENVPSAWVAGVEAAGMKIEKMVSRGGREILNGGRSSSCLLDVEQSLVIGAAKLISMLLNPRSSRNSFFFVKRKAKIPSEQRPSNESRQGVAL